MTSIAASTLQQQQQLAAAGVGAAPPVVVHARRESLNGCWILDRHRGTPSMRQYLETMGVDELTIQAHEKGETERETYHTIDISPDQKIRIVKRSRVNNDIVVELELGKELVTLLPPGNREKKTLATSMDNGQTTLQLKSSLLTVNGLASVMDIKQLIQEEHNTVLMQELTITNATTLQTHKTVRYFYPYTQTPPHLEDQEMADVNAAAATAAAATAAKK
eukprot:CAMPEP_0119004292 /NCGR_PEP_ID=MMETSP1176-20130426/1061_1 /TAXON_ID=265551 /ORGANISM="Synedropsis recta cf, Strain CCMP1620" /LENGTH=219 /DNA_ID=CAMNT_0006955979 /DNA_START=1 /DNA_END=660 /DNA_ORIENTATION=+